MKKVIKNVHITLSIRLFFQEECKVVKLMHYYKIISNIMSATENNAEGLNAYQINSQRIR